MIKEFQKKYKLSLVDGKAGKEVFEKMKSLVESLGKKQIKKYVDFPWGDKERKKMALYIKQQVDKKFEGPNFTEEEIQNSYNSQKQQVHDSLDNEINNFVPPEFFKNDTIVEDTLNEMKRQADSE
jgi:isopentenyl diphosphate isomerase/L-lactate dehydrogenase-like FMN-dependent dehydrogenase